jgi:hypothetical protein
MTESHANGHAPHGGGYEKTDTGIGLIIWGTVGLVMLTAITLVIVWGIFNYFKHREELNHRVVNPMAVPSQLPPEPRLQIKPDEQIILLRGREEHILSSYAWVDQKSGVVRVPIDRAMDLLMQKGLPVRGTAAAPARKSAQSTKQEGTQGGTR